MELNIGALADIGQVDARPAHGGIDLILRFTFTFLFTGASATVVIALGSIRDRHPQQVINLHRFAHLELGEAFTCSVAGARHRNVDRLDRGPDHERVVRGQQSLAAEHGLNRDVQLLTSVQCVGFIVVGSILEDVPLVLVVR